MADQYTATGTVNCAASPGATALGVIAGTLTRGRVNFFTLSCSGTPADNAIYWQARTITAAGTSSALTPTKVDLASPAAQLGAQQTYTAEPTFGVTLFAQGVHQRAYYQWQALPGREWLIPATANAGIGFTPSNASYTGATYAVAQWEE